MKLLLIILTTVFIPSNLVLDQCGQDDDPSLNRYEVDYFNYMFLDQREDFDFGHKRVAFFTGSLGTTLSSKSEYFNDLGTDNSQQTLEKHQSHAETTRLLILTSEEKQQINYDIILISGSKILITDNLKSRIIETLKNDH